MDVIVMLSCLFEIFFGGLNGKMIVLVFLIFIVCGIFNIIFEGFWFMLIVNDMLVVFSIDMNLFLGLIEWGG